MRIRELAAAALAVGVSLSSSGCASIIKGGGPETVSLRSAPADADVKIIDMSNGNVIQHGKTPLMVALAKSRGFFQGARYQVVFDKPGFATREVTLDTRVSGWYVGGNLIFGGLIGWLIVDPATGAMWTLSQDEVSVDLTPIAPAAPAVAPAAAPVPQASAPVNAPAVAVITVQELAAQRPDLLARMNAVPVR